MNSLRNVIGKRASREAQDTVVESSQDNTDSGGVDGGPEAETLNTAAQSEPSLFLAKWRQRRTQNEIIMEGTQVQPVDNPARGNMAEESTSTLGEEEVIFMDSSNDGTDATDTTSKPIWGQSDQDSVVTEDWTDVSENQTCSDSSDQVVTTEEVLSDPRGIRGFMAKLRSTRNTQPVDQGDHAKTPDNGEENSETGNVQEEALSSVQMEGRDPCEPQDNKPSEKDSTRSTPRHGVARRILSRQFIPNLRLTGQKRSEGNTSKESRGLNQQEGCVGNGIGRGLMNDCSEEIILVYENADDVNDATQEPSSVKLAEEKTSLAALDNGEEKCEDTVETTQEEQPLSDIPSNDTTSQKGLRRWMPRLRSNFKNDKRDSDALGGDVVPNQVLSDPIASDKQPPIEGFPNADMTFDEEKEEEESDQKLQVGDHVFQWCSFVGIPGVFQHHGIVCGVAEDEDDLNLQIADFSGLMHQSVGSGPRLFSRRNGEDFEEEHSPYTSVLRLYNSSSNQAPRWRKVKYSCSSWTAHIRRAGTCTTAPSDTTEQVVARLHFLLANPEVLPPYHVFHANCECVAVWCKTGRWATLQGSSILGYAAAGQAKFTATAAAVAASQQVAVTTQATGVWGMLGYTTTTTASMATVNPMVLPAIAGYGAVAVGGPFVLLLRSKKKWAETTGKLNDEFWDAAMKNPDLFETSMMEESNLSDKEISTTAPMSC